MSSIRAYLYLTQPIESYSESLVSLIDSMKHLGQGGLGCGLIDGVASAEKDVVARADALEDETKKEMRRDKKGEKEYT